MWICTKIRLRFISKSIIYTMCLIQHFSNAIVVIVLQFSSTKKGFDSVFVVERHDYDKCNMDNTTQTRRNGDSEFKFDRSGPFFFISGHDNNCEKGEKLTIVVMSDHHHTHIVPPRIHDHHPCPVPLRWPICRHIRLLGKHWHILLLCLHSTKLTHRHLKHNLHHHLSSPLFLS